MQSLYHPLKHSALRVFDPIMSTKSTGRNYCNIKLATELGLRSYDTVAHKAPATQIINHLRKIPQAGETLDVGLGHGISFENEPNSLRNLRESSQIPRQLQIPQRSQPAISSSISSDSTVSTNYDRTRAD